MWEKESKDQRCCVEAKKKKKEDRKMNKRIRLCRVDQRISSHFELAQGWISKRVDFDDKGDVL